MSPASSSPKGFVAVPPLGSVRLTVRSPPCSFHLRFHLLSFFSAQSLSQFLQKSIAFFSLLSLYDRVESTANSSSSHMYNTRWRCPSPPRSCACAPASGSRLGWTACEVALTTAATALQPCTSCHRTRAHPRWLALLVLLHHHCHHHLPAAIVLKEQLVANEVRLAGTSCCSM